MEQGEGFKHITVTVAEEEDVVIHAGLGEAPVPEEPEPAPEPVSAPEPALVSAPEVAAKPKPKPVPEDGYHETTLEDLQDRSMPLAQRIVIIAAIICIIGAVIYCFAFMR